MTNPTLPIIVLRSNDICFLGILRSCRASGIPVIPIIFSWPGAPVWHSELSEGFYHPHAIANPFTDAKTAATQLSQILKQLFKQFGQKLMVLPSSDTNMMFLMDHFEQFSPFAVMMGNREYAEPRHDVIHKFECTKQLAKTCAKHVPVTLRCNNKSDIDAVVENMIYPAIYKPAVKDYGQSFYRNHNGNKAIQCDTADSLRKSLHQEVEAGYDLVVQEKLIFDSVYDEIPFYLFADKNGNIKMAGNGIKELIDPFPFGTAIVLRFAWYPELLELAKAVVDALSYRGILMIEFVKDQKDDQWKVVEVNPRHWLFNGFYQRLGLNYSQQLFLDYHQRSGIDGTMITASESTIKKNYAHIDLVAVAENWIRKNPYLTFENYLSGLDQIDGGLSSVYLDPDDLNPGLSRIAAMLERYQWPSNGLDQIIRRLAL